MCSHCKPVAIRIEDEHLVTTYPLMPAEGIEKERWEAFSDSQRKQPIAVETFEL